MFNYDVIRKDGPILSTSPIADPLQDCPPHSDNYQEAAIPAYQDPFAMTVMPSAAQQERRERIANISQLIAAHLDNGDITEQDLNNFLRKNQTRQFQ